MRDHRAIHARVLGFFLITSSLLIFISNYIELSEKLVNWNQENLFWDILLDTIPFHIVSIFMAIFSFRLYRGLQAAHSKAVKWWTFLCLFLLGDSIYTLTVQFHFLIVLKVVFLAYLTGYALIKYRHKFDGNANDHI